MTRLTWAVRSALFRPAAPVVKFSMVGMRPKADSAKKVIAAAAPVGSIMPTHSPARVPALNAEPSAKLARRISS